jgi:hypothetical protein
MEHDDFIVDIPELEGLGIEPGHMARLGVHMAVRALPQRQRGPAAPPGCAPPPAPRGHRLRAFLSLPMSACRRWTVSGR